MISIIIPVLNEAETIERLLGHISNNASEKNIVEILVVDGGSCDGTQDIVHQYAKFSSLNVKLLASEKGRAKQMNLGAKNALGEIFYFLHSDSFPPKSFDKLILSEIVKENFAGCFRMKFDSRHPLLQFSQWFTQFNFKVCRGGDQSLFITRELFAGLNGFNENYIIYEDCEFINRVYAKHHFTIIPKHIVTSSRKYRKVGAWKLQFHFTMLHAQHRLGKEPEVLYNYYCKHIN
jgi:rSAM/selenodomain-associated transferase 2